MDKNRGNPGDDEIIHRVLNGDINAFEEIVTRYKPLVFTMVSRRLPAEEVEAAAHDVFIRAYTGLGGYKGKAGFKNWLSGIAIRTSADFWRKAYKRHEIAESRLSDGQLKWIETALAGASAKTRDREDTKIEAREITDHLLGRLSAADRMVMELVYLEGYTHKEAAVLMGSNIAAVKVRVFRARKKLRTYIEKLNRTSSGRKP